MPVVAGAKLTSLIGAVARLYFRRHKTLSSLFGAPAGIRTPNQQIMRRFEGHRQGETKRDKPAFTNPQWSKFVTSCYVSARHRAIIASSLIVRLAYFLGRRQV